MSLSLAGKNDRPPSSHDEGSFASMVVGGWISFSDCEGVCAFAATPQSRPPRRMDLVWIGQVCCLPVLGSTGKSAFSVLMVWGSSLAS
jgi:hypothetical protein